ncbi:hypothetical protein [Bacillus mycoides]|uniref:hypothetical protein n=1 Tax=Bacillus mycoides TaxID=1405 RepID=UPI002E2002EF|nr:hypothetical protein [Bacillus mycoides]
MKKIEIVQITFDKEKTDAKECRGCGITKPLFDYYPNKRGVGEKSAKCKDCESKRKGYKTRRDTKKDYKISNLKITLTTIEKDGDEKIAKECSVCRKVKILDEFHRNKKALGGRHSCCKECNREKNGSKKRIKKWTNDRFTELLPKGWIRLEEVINCSTGVLVQCNNGHIFKKRPNDLKKHKKCNKCHHQDLRTNNIKWTNEFLDNKLREQKKGWQRIGEVNGVFRVVTLTCDKGHINYKAPNDIFRTNCPICSNKEKWTNDRFDNILPNGWKRIEDVINAYTPIELICDKGHKLKVCPSNFENGSRCSKCNSIGQIHYGREFECIVDELLLEINMNYKKGFNQKLKPDYVLKNNIWMDAKLSRTTILNSSRNTIEKYEPHCKLLVIIFFRGEKTFDKMITQKTRMISVYKLIKQLSKHKQKLFLGYLNDLELKIKETTEIAPI